MQVDGTHQDAARHISQAMLHTLKTLVIVTILADSSAGGTDGFSIPSQNSPTSSTGTAIRAELSKHTCHVTSTDAVEAYRLLQTGNFTEARVKLQSALRIAEASAVPEPINRACLMNMMGFVELQHRRPDLAIGWFERGLELKPLSDSLAALLTSNLASTLCDLNQLDRAEEIARRAIRLSERAFGSDDPEVTFPQTTLAFIYVARGEYASAESILRRVFDQAERTWSPMSYEVSVAANNLAFIYFVRGAYAGARDLFQKSLAGLESNPMRARDEIPLTQAALAASCAAGGRDREANMWMERALAYAQQELRSKDPAVPAILERVAVARFFQRDYKSGRKLFDGAITGLEALYGSGSQQVQDALGRYSDLLGKTGDKSLAKKVEQRRKALAMLP
ncbi:MAG TPA: tetratricopeptide repeat protein [Bryobacteraceae bacterium]